MMRNTISKYGFNFLSGVKNPPIHLISVGIQQVDHPSYSFENSGREECYLFQYTLSGTGNVIINGERNTVCAGEGFLLHMPDDSKYYFDKSAGSEPWKFIYTRFCGFGCEPYFNLIIENFGHILSLEENMPSIRALFEIYRRADTGLIKDSFTSERLIFDFLCKLCTDTFNNEDSFSDIVIKARNLINTRFADIDGISDIAEELCVSQSHLSRTFSAETKQSLINYLTFAKLGEAINLLVGTEESVEEIAKKCGFSCGNYFCKVFRKHMGTSPLEYRRQNK